MQSDVKCSAAPVEEATGSTDGFMQPDPLITQRCAKADEWGVRNSLVEAVRAFGHLPYEMRKLPNWVPWGYQQKTGQAKKSKVPKQSQNPKFGASTTNPSHWGALQDALAAQLANGLNGVGFVLTNTPFLGVDLDDAFDASGRLLPWAERIVKAFRECAFIEMSPSGRGLHLITRGSLKPGSWNKVYPEGKGNSGVIEMYDTGRYFTVTGKVYSGCATIGEGQEAVARLQARYQKVLQTAVLSRSVSDIGDQAIIERAMKASNGMLFSALWSGDTSQYGGDHSRADSALCACLAFYTRDPEQIDRIFRASGLMRAKWDERRGAETYGYITVRKALDTVDTPARAASRRLKTLRGSQAEDGSQAAALLTTICAADIELAEIEWLWKGWLALSRIQILGGMPGTGKTTLLMLLAAVVSVGGRWPDGTGCHNPGNVVIWSGEDDASDTLVPRLDAAGADRSKIHFVGNVNVGEKKRSFNPKKDMSLLIETILRIGDVRLLIIDPIVSIVSGDSHKNTEVRQSFEPLAQLASDAKCAVVGITHFTKGTKGSNPLERLTGSIAFSAVPRVVMVAAKKNEGSDDAGRIFVRAKSNIGPDGDGFLYDLEEVECPSKPSLLATRVSWGDAVFGSAQELLGRVESDPGRGGAMAEAKDFLLSILAHGPVAPTVIESEAKTAGIAKATLRRAKDSLGIKSEKSGFEGGWGWALPKSSTVDEDAHPITTHLNMSIFVENEHLRGEEHEDAHYDRRCSLPQVDEHLGGGLHQSTRIIEVEL